MIYKFNIIFWAGVVNFLIVIVILASPSVKAVVNNPTSSQDVILNGCKKKGRLESLEIPGFLSSTNSKLTFRVTPNPPSCKSKTELTLTSSTTTGSVHFLPNGYFRNDTEYFHPSEYCIKSSNGDTRLKITLCRTECSSQRPCSQKCCPLGQILKEGTGCIDETSASVELDSVKNEPNLNIAYLQRIPHYRRSSDSEAMTSEALTRTPFHYTRTTSKVIRSNCLSTLLTEYVDDGENSHRELFRLTLNGNLNIKNVTNGSWLTIFPGHYCLDEVMDKGTIILHCSDGVLMKPEEETNRIRGLIIGIILVMSSIFLLLTFIVYAFILKQRNVHAWTTMSLTATMFFTYTFLAVSHFINAHEYSTLFDRQITKRCMAIGILAHFFFISMFFWLTAVCFDLWWTFRAITPRNKNSTGWSRYLAHAAFGWGAPLIIIIVSVSLNFFYSCSSDDGSSCGVILPHYGKKNCYLAYESFGAYLYYPAAVLLTINWIFFLLTFYKLHEYKQSTKMAMQNTQEKRRLLILCLKLFFVMGISWLAEIFSWLYSDPDDPEWYWYITDIFNILQAMAIFLIFTCKKETLDAFKAMMPEKKPNEYQMVRTKSNTTTKVSQPSGTDIPLATRHEEDGRFSYTQTTSSFATEPISET